MANVTGYKRAALASTLGVLFCVNPAFAQEKCVTIAGGSYSPDQIFDPLHQCGTCPGQRSKPGLCGSLNRLMVAEWSAPSDLIVVPHRGYWGTPRPRDYPENTMGAVAAASQRDFKFIEIDIALSGTGSDNKRKPFLGHYFTLASASADRDASPSQLAPVEIVRFKMNHRDQTPGRDSLDSFVMLDDVIDFAKANDLILMVDPKDPPGASPDHLQMVMAYALNLAKKKQALAHLVIKTRFGYTETVNAMQPYLDDAFDTYDGRFLWSPITSASLGDKTLSQVIDFIDNWRDSTNVAKKIAVYETNIYSPQYEGGQSFTVRGKSYTDLIDYVRQLTPVTKRSALWSVDPMGNKGTLSRLYTWKFIGNETSDKRGNPLTTMSYSYSRHSLVTTDIPDTYLFMVKR